MDQLTCQPATQNNTKNPKIGKLSNAAVGHMAVTITVKIIAKNKITGHNDAATFKDHEGGSNKNCLLIMNEDWEI